RSVVQDQSDSLQSVQLWWQLHEPFAWHTSVAGIATEDSQSCDSISDRCVGYFVANRLHPAYDIVARGIGHLRRACEEDPRSLRHITERDAGCFHPDEYFATLGNRDGLPNQTERRGRPVS